MSFDGVVLMDFRTYFDVIGPSIPIHFISSMNFGFFIHSRTFPRTLMPRAFRRLTFRLARLIFATRRRALAPGVRSPVFSPVAR